MTAIELDALRETGSIYGAARKLGVGPAGFYNRVQRARAAGEAIPLSTRASHWKGLRDDDASEWGGSKEKRCKCGLRLEADQESCVSCVPPLAHFATRHLGDHRAVANPPTTTAFTAEEMARVRRVKLDKKVAP